MIGKKIILQLIPLFVYYITIFLLLFEIFSYISTQFNLLIFNDTPVYNSTQLRDDNDWRIKDPIIGSWHKPFGKDRHVTRCFDIEYRSNNIFFVNWFIAVIKYFASCWFNS
jgi:hypothetical protein